MSEPIDNAAIGGSPVDGSQQEEKEGMSSTEEFMEETALDIDYTKISEIVKKREHNGEVQYLIKWADPAKMETWVKHHQNFIGNIVGFELAHFFLNSHELLVGDNFMTSSAAMNSIRIEHGDYNPGVNDPPPMVLNYNAFNYSDSDLDEDLSNSVYSYESDDNESIDSYTEGQIENHIHECNQNSRYDRTSVMEEIIGVSMSRQQQLTFLVKWRDIDELDIVPFVTIYRKWRQEVIDYFHRRHESQ